VQGRKTMRFDTMVVAVAVRLGVAKLAWNEVESNPPMSLDLHDHGVTSKLRFRSVASGAGLERALRVEKPSAVHPKCEAVLELDRDEDFFVTTKSSTLSMI
jgi:hypothetical protein